MLMAEKLRKVIYVSNARLPTEKAHGYQISQMCQGFIKLGLDVRLISPNRKTDITQSLKDYYNLSVELVPDKLYVLDLFPLIARFGKYGRYKILQTISFYIATISYAVSASFALKKLKNDTCIYYFRDPLLLFLVSILSSDKILNNVVLELHSLPSSKLKNYIYQHFQKKLKSITSLTQQTKSKLLEQGYFESNISVSPDGVDLDTFNLSISTKDARKKLNLPAAATIAMYVGKFHTNGMEKGIPEIIESAKYLINKYHDLIFCFVGGPLDRVPYYNELIVYNGLPLDRFLFLEKQPVKMVPIYLKAANMLLMPHPPTNFYMFYISPLKLFEYMVSRRPIVASDLLSIREILKDAINALLCVPGDSKSLAMKIELLINNPDMADKIAYEAFTEVKKYTWIQRADNIIKMLS
jgi:glycosyltransferase involved in cell wall biosynthesis